jgi:mannonate dehydratase
MAIHPDDPPFAVLGLPRIMSHADHIRAMLENTTSSHVGLCFCTGSYGARKENDLPKMFREFGSRVYFLHLRSTKRDPAGNFFEDDHLAGDADLYTIIKLAAELQHTENRSIPMRPDHGHQLSIDQHIDSFPGYSFVGRLKGLAEISGMEHAIYQQRAENGL